MRCEHADYMFIENKRKSVPANPQFSIGKLLDNFLFDRTLMTRLPADAVRQG